MDMEFVYLKLNDNYSNHFLTTNQGETFYKDWLSQKRPEYVAVNKNIFDKSFELRELVRTHILILKDKIPKIKNKKEPIIENKKEIPIIKNEKEIPIIKNKKLKD